MESGETLLRIWDWLLESRKDLGFCRCLAASSEYPPLLCVGVDFTKSRYCSVLCEGRVYWEG